MLTSYGNTWKTHLKKELSFQMVAWEHNCKNTNCKKMIIEVIIENNLKGAINYGVNVITHYLNFIINR